MTSARPDPRRRPQETDASSPAAAGTVERILDAAENLFAERGFAATSLRAITAEAEVNLAAVHYHFGSKERLFQEVFRRHIEPVNAERIRLLDALEASAAAPQLEDVLEVFLRPALRLARTPRGPVLMRLAARLNTERGAHWDGVTAQFEVAKQRLLAALQRALPELPVIELFWRLHFMIGVMCHTMADTYRLRLISGGVCDPTDVEGMLRQLVPFLAAGFRAPATSTVLDPRGRP